MFIAGGGFMCIGSDSLLNWNPVRAVPGSDLLF
jgi:ABC-type uncharacterized transport system permease subunit